MKEKSEYFDMEDILNDILLSEKTISNNYSVAINEMSNMKLYNDITKIFLDTKDASRDIYNLMLDMGLYQITKEEKKKIDKSYNKYNKKLTELS